MEEKTVCFIGHRKINDTPELRQHLQSLLLQLIESGTVNFIFGDNSAFNALCYEIVTALKEEHPQIKRIFYRKNYEDADDYTMRFLLSGYEESICPKGIGRAGKAGYTERNQAMIIESEICVFYYDESYLPSRCKNNRHNSTDYQPKSGTALAYAYALQKRKRIFNMFKLSP
ncbi:MAG: hypothetical protein MJ177_00940 [Clostridia bacterium]|nr:hypothetical protein [Clostridia bacterium]